MKERNLLITHEMILKDTHLYLITDLKGIVENLKRYKNIERVETLKIGSTIYLKLRGTRTMYGYKVEDGGFYDIINDLYYNPYQMESAEIINISRIDDCVIKKKESNAKLNFSFYKII